MESSDEGSSEKPTPLIHIDESLIQINEMNESRLSNSPLMESSSELSHRNISKYIRANFKNSQILDFQAKRNYRDIVEEGKVGNEIEEEEINTTKTKRLSFIHGK